MTTFPTPPPAWRRTRTPLLGATCQTSEPGASDRRHIAFGADVELSLQDEIHSEGAYVGLPSLSVMVEQHVTAAEPTICLYSESAKVSSVATRHGMDLDMTRDEAIRLRDELTRWIDVTDVPTEAAK